MLQTRLIDGAYENCLYRYHAFDAEAKLSQFLQEVKCGRCYRITVDGRPIADLIPSERAISQDVHADRKDA